MPYVVRWSYLLGLACAMVAVGWRGMMTLGYFVPDYITLGRTIYDMSFYKGALLFLLLSMASASYEQSRERHRGMQKRSRELAAE